MLRNYLTVAWRRLRRHPTFSLLNVVGLAAGLACVLLIGLWVEDELSYDTFHEKSDRTYRLVREFNLPNREAVFAYTPSALAPTLETDVPEVETAVRTMVNEGIVERGEHRFSETGILFADPGFFDLFDFPLVRGTKALDRPNTVLLTPKMAAKYFPETDPIGKTIQLNRPMEVTGIVAEPPSNSSIQFNFIASLTNSPRVQEPDWMDNTFRTYALLRPDASRRAFEKQLATIVTNHMAPAYESETGNEYPENGYALHPQPVTGIHLGQGLPVEISSAGSIKYVYLFSVLALFVLALACINFMNLATARSLQRANEVGVRKAIGANSRQLIGQFLGEAILTTGLSLASAIGLCVLLLPTFNDLAGTSIAVSTLFSPSHLLAVIGLLFLVGCAAGSYPAFVLGQYNPAETLRDLTSSSRGSPGLRKGLVVFQFAISIVLLAGTITVKKQVDYMTSKGLGFNENNVVVLDRIRSVGAQTKPLKEKMTQHASVERVAGGFSLPGTFFVNEMWRADVPDPVDRNLNYTFVGPNYLDLLEVDVIAGRDFSADRATDSSAVVLNRAAANEFGWTPEEALGQHIQNGPNAPPQTVIGVTKNFHYESLRAEISPLALFHQSSDWQRRYLAVRIQSDQSKQALDALRATWEEFSDLPFEYSFLADDLAAQYEAEQRLQTLFAIFAGLAILIACLGLLGLAAYAAEQRRKEIGIRKALGATVGSIIGLLSRQFLALVGLSFVVSTPIAYLGLRSWLYNFPYQIDLGLSVFVLAGALAIAIAALTVSTQAWRAARTDPAQVLQAE